MLAFRKTAPAFGADIVTVPEPTLPAAGMATIEVAAAGICGSDIHAYEWTSGYEFMQRFLPLTLGHEFSGIVEAVGEGVQDIQVGDRVVCWPTIACEKCHACSAGRPQDCSDRRIIGFHVNGGFAGRVTVPAINCRVVPTDLPLDVAALAEPLAVAVHAVNTADISAGDQVVVLGPGPIGLGMAFVASKRGAEVLVAGFNDDVRLKHARDLGVAATVDLARETLREAVEQHFGRPVDRVLEATGISTSVAEGLAVLRSSGIFVVAGIHSRPLELDLTRFVREKKQLRAAHDTTNEALSEAISLLADHAQVLSAMATHRCPLSKAAEGFELARSREAVKVLLIPDGEQE
ncbi:MULTISPECIES: alcohol dehydrogenase catalytic domain-containing protein [Rhizobium/Agrobacterium group]|uniref:Alcohol dehydrogenase catalytic domain-containing protein n=2 Tax=Neorhizobium TaxID=1525371 RepID=A0ABV0MEH6_9HYPH|nr:MULTISPECIES: alcohol dehydrogenase catalytic domain-containing protein [Rhizobium/Agrobacterium group]KGE01921.1 sorbitol dehydrogenase [Rhizobium sp. YS-1r]MCC2609714.1 alcohol dehydrogenase catalytic domain-containing protein [Neorhizobium petrolearium]WGI69909.1 alcohol dehydrogenase catalytic domain-containing protein [Neorhizobium petrolearium]